MSFAAWVRNRAERVAPWRRPRPRPSFDPDPGVWRLVASLAGLARHKRLAHLMTADEEAVELARMVRGIGYELVKREPEP